MTDTNIRTALIVLAIPLFWLFIVYPIKAILRMMIPEGKLKKMLFKNH